MLKRKIKIGYISQNDPNDRIPQSGISYNMCRCFENMGAEIVWIKPKKTLMYKIGEMLYRVFSKIIRRPILYNFTLFGSKELAKGVDKRLFDKVDLFLSINSTSIVAFLDLNKPLIHRSDATFNLLVDYYYPHNIAKWNIKEGNIIYQNVLDKSSIVINASQWAKQSGIYDYNQPEEKIFVIESGVNIDDKDIKSEIKNCSTDKPVNLLFIGVDWERKGGSIALDACKFLYDNDINVTLNIVGIKNLDPDIEKLSYINNIGFLNKNIPLEYNKLVSLIQSSHLLLLPTIAECAGLVFCESSAYGLPSFTHDTGGVGNYVINGVNGYRLPLGSTGEDFGLKILQTIQSGELNILSKQAIELYTERLNWNVWKTKVEKIINDII